jgi:hypothetical protein
LFGHIFSPSLIFSYSHFRIVLASLFSKEKKQGGGGGGKGKWDALADGSTE